MCHPLSPAPPGELCFSRRQEQGVLRGTSGTGSGGCRGREDGPEVPRGVGRAPHLSCGLLAATASGWPRCHAPSAPRSDSAGARTKPSEMCPGGRARPDTPPAAAEQGSYTAHTTLCLSPSFRCPFPHSVGKLPARSHVPVSPRHLPFLPQGFIVDFNIPVTETNRKEPPPSPVTAWEGGGRASVNPPLGSPPSR